MASIGLLTVVAVDRYLTICRPDIGTVFLVKNHSLAGFYELRLKLYRFIVRGNSLWLYVFLCRKKNDYPYLCYPDPCCLDKCRLLGFHAHCRLGWLCSRSNWSNMHSQLEEKWCVRFLLTLSFKFLLIEGSDCLIYYCIKQTNKITHKINLLAEVWSLIYKSHLKAMEIT